MTIRVNQWKQGLINDNKDSSMTSRVITDHEDLSMTTRIGKWRLISKLLKVTTINVFPLSFL